MIKTSGTIFTQAGGAGPDCPSGDAAARTALSASKVIVTGGQILGAEPALASVLGTKIVVVVVVLVILVLVFVLENEDTEDEDEDEDDGICAGYENSARSQSLPICVDPRSSAVSTE